MHASPRIQKLSFASLGGEQACPCSSRCCFPTGRVAKRCSESKNRTLGGPPTTPPADCGEQTYQSMIATHNKDFRAGTATYRPRRPFALAAPETERSNCSLIYNQRLEQGTEQVRWTTVEEASETEGKRSLISEIIGAWAARPTGANRITECSAMDNDGLGRTILSAIRNAPVEFAERILRPQKSLDDATPEPKPELKRRDSDPGPPTTPKSETQGDGEGREDLICIKKAEKKDDPKMAEDDTDRRKRLLRAVCADDVDVLQKILRETPELVDFSFPFTHNYTPLHFAAKGGHRKTARVLLASGANLYAQTTFRYTPHHLAAMADDLEMLDLLDAFVPEDKPRLLLRDLSGKTFEDYLEKSDRIHLHSSHVSLCRSSPSPLPPKEKDSLNPLDSSFSRFDTVRRTVGKFFAREGTPAKK
ncbi:hypothetical protein QR680_009696 [Steinernema hermaphroditum]|uniref:Uncharacterized protein n=1 Tax=Steinernema hermaphroditum TaxID=289476 RepID=A0AA39IMP9_9BILA|nr:hypothetical protein QR680_009696 [Steinernema hermaphroditum]